MKTVLMLAALATTLSSFAYAADLPSSQQAPVFAPPPPIPVFVWTGPYVGLNVGYGFGHERYDIDVAAEPVFFSGTDRQHNSGVVGGGQIGYNYQIGGGILGGGIFGGALVIGAEADFDGTGIANSGLLDIPNVFARVSNRLNYFGTARGRLGVAFDRALVFGTGGFAYGNYSTTVFAPFNFINDHTSHLATGFVVGGGFEFAVTNNVLLRAEYLRLDFDGGSATGGDPWMNYHIHQHPIENIVRVGLDYQFGLPAPVPVVARY